MFAVQETLGQGLAFLVVIVLVVVGSVRRARRRANMTAAERTSDDLREEMVRLRREMRRRH